MTAVGAAHGGNDVAYDPNPTPDTDPFSGDRTRL